MQASKCLRGKLFDYSSVAGSPSKGRLMFRAVEKPSEFETGFKDGGRNREN